MTSDNALPPSDRVEQIGPKQPDIGARLSFDRSAPGRQAVFLPALDVPEAELPPAAELRADLHLPEMSQLDLVRYFTSLSALNYSIDGGFYPLGSCTMKYNPKVDEELGRLPDFTKVHPLQPAETAQGCLRVLWELQNLLAEIVGMNAAALSPMAGADGELSGVLMIKAYQQSRGEGHRRQILVADSAHGTNPATAAMCGYEVVSVPTDSHGDMDLSALERALRGPVAGLMLTLPNTLGLFEREIVRIADLVHASGALLYGDGANLNAIAGQVKPGALGFDVMHINTHKTFSTPHGGGGPGAGPVTVKADLAPLRPGPVVERLENDTFTLSDPPQSIGRLGLFFGNFGVLLRAYAYIRTLGAEGLRAMSEAAVLNANYVQERLRDAYQLPFDRRCMHETVFSGSRQRANGVRTLDIAKRLIDYGFHPPTIYFPLIVEEALMIEPTEAESMESLDRFCDAMLAIAREADEQPELVRGAPYSTRLGRLDEAEAARHPVLRWQS